MQTFRTTSVCLGLGLCIACGDAPGSDGQTGQTETSDTSDGDGDGDGDPGDGDGDGDSGDGDGDSGDGDGDGDGDSGDGDGDIGNLECDYEVDPNGILMFEAESLDITEDWTIAADVPGHYGSGYIYWAGQSFNNQPGNGLIEVVLGIDQPGRYRMQWRTQIGLGMNATEHNDVWLRFPDAADYYGKNGDNPETRRYPKPICDDAGFIAMIEALPQVSVASCAAGSSVDGWMKVYSSGAQAWKWSAQTSDSDAHQIYVEFDAPGAYTLQLSARADLSLLDRVVLHREEVGNESAQAEGQAETPCD